MKRRMKTSKKALCAYGLICGILLVYTMMMLWFGKDSTTLTVLATAAVAALPAVYKIYTDSSDKEKMIHMEKNYNPNYDEENNIY